MPRYLMITNYDYDMELEAFASLGELCHGASATFDLDEIPDGDRLEAMVEAVAGCRDEWKSFAFLLLDPKTGALADLPLSATGHSLLATTADLCRQAAATAPFGSACPHEAALLASDPDLARIVARWVWIFATTDDSHTQEARAFRSWRSGIEFIADRFGIDLPEHGVGSLAALGTARASEIFWEEVIRRYQADGWKGEDFWCLDPTTMKRAVVPGGKDYCDTVRTMAIHLG